jgi:membrane protein DedA with SNARE-associated domain
MASTFAGSRADQTGTDVYTANRTFLLIAAVARAVLGIVAIPLAPFLFREHAAVLVFLRPTKEVLLLAGFLVRRGDTSLPVVVVAALPILLGGVWVMFALGRAYADSLDAEDLPRLVRRVLPPKRIEEMRETINERGMSVVFLGRLAAFPSTVVAAAAGASSVSTRRFLLADTAGALLSLGLLVTGGYVLGEAYEDAGPWVTAAGVVVLAAVVVVLGRSLLRPSRRKRR